jgi:hypothetical protein
MSKRLSKEDIRNNSGVLNPIGHIVLAFKDDAMASQAVTALRAAGSAEEATPRLRERVRTTSEAAGFGYEITLMRRYLAFAEQGAGWLIVYAPNDSVAAHITDIAKRFDALCAVRYHLFANEDLI